MTIKEFGQKIQQQYPEYNKSDPTQIGNEFLQKYPQYQDKVEGYNEGALSKAIDKTGLFNVPIVGGLLRGAVPGAETVAQAVAPNQYYNQQNSIVSPNEYYQLTNPKASLGDVIKVGAGTGLQAGLSVDAVADAPNLVREAPNLVKSIGQKFIPSQTGKAIAQVGEKATAQGVNDTFHDFSTEVRQQVEKKFGKTTEHAKALNQRLSGMQPADITGNAKLTPSDLIDIRQQAANRLKNASGKLSIGSAQDQVDEVIRDVASKRAKDITPGLSKLDRSYSMQKKLYPVLKTKALKYGGVGAGAGVGLDLLGQLLKGLGQGSDQTR